METWHNKHDAVIYKFARFANFLSNMKVSYGYEVYVSTLKLNIVFIIIAIST